MQRKLRNSGILLFLLFTFHTAFSSSTYISIDTSSQALVAPQGHYYQWYHNNERIEGANSQSFVVSESGHYSVEVVDIAGELAKPEIVVGLTATGALIKIYLIGDSTVCNYNASAYPQTGWGQLLSNFFNASNITIDNRAIGGRSSRSFFEEGRWTAIKDALKAGDYVFIQFGHNDRDFSNAARYTSVPDYKTYLTTYCNEAKAKGAVPVLVSPMVMNAWTGTTMRNVFTENGNNYRGGMLEVATALNVAFIDLNMKSWNLYKTYGSAFNTRFLYKGFVAGEYPNYPNAITDGTHFQEMGSLSHCRMIVEGIKELSSRADMANLVNNLRPLYSIGISVNPTGSDEMTTKTGTYPQGVTITLKTLPKTTGSFQKWNNASGTQLSTATLTTVTSGSSATSYTAVYKGAITCPATMAADGPTTFCQGGSVTLTANTGSSYVWKNGATQVGTSPTYKATTSGTYTVIVTNSSNCSATSSETVVTVNVPTTWYADADGDGKGDPNVKQTACTQPTGYVLDNTDLCPTDANKASAGVCGCGKAETSCVDCNSTPNGSALLDNCDRCVGGTTGKTACSSVAEAETEACSFDGVTENTNSGFKGSSYLNTNNALGAAITFHVQANMAVTATLSFRYASSTDRPAQLILNGVTLPNTIPFPNTAAFTTWSTTDVNLNLSKGNNILVLSPITALGLANIDQIGYVSEGLTKGSCLLTSIQNEREEKSIFVYPNPSYSSFHIQLQGEFEYAIVDAMGKTMEQGNSIDKTAIGHHLPAGLYLIQLRQAQVYSTISVLKK